jgi:hypothetical protein
MSVPEEYKGGVALAQIRHKKDMAYGHVLNLKCASESYSGWHESQISDSHTSLPSRLIVHSPSEQLRLTRRENHSPKLHKLKSDWA